MSLCRPLMWLRRDLEESDPLVFVRYCSIVFSQQRLTQSGPCSEHTQALEKPLQLCRESKADVRKVPDTLPSSKIAIIFVTHGMAKRLSDAVGRGFKPLECYMDGLCQSQPPAEVSCLFLQRRSMSDTVARKQCHRAEKVFIRYSIQQKVDVCQLYTHSTTAQSCRLTKSI